MARLPIEVLCSSSKVQERIARTLQIANAIQGEFHFAACGDQSISDVAEFSPTGELNTNMIFDKIEAARERSRGFHPFMFMFCNSYLVGNQWKNLFGDHRAHKGLAIVTFHDVDSIVGPDDDSYTGYALYYIARYCMSFVSPSVKNHQETRQCLFDFKATKTDIIESVRAGALCDLCRADIMRSGKGTIAQMNAVDRLVDFASSLIHKTAIKRRANIFIGSSTKHVEQARSLKGWLDKEFRVQVWDEDQVFRLGSATIEQLEEHVNYYDFGVFLMMPDDDLRRGNLEHKVPRDNVVFETGLFTGKLSRKRTLIVTTSESEVTLPSDLNGLTTIRIDLARPDTLREAAKRAETHIKYVFGQGQA